MNVKLIRMSSGEDVVATVVEDGDELLTIQDAIVAIPTGQGQMGFAPWSPILSKEQKEIPVNKKFVVYVAEVNSDIVDQYKQMFSTIVTPEKKLIL
jgi:hypothetical protein